MSTFCFKHAEKLLASCDTRAHAAAALETGDESLLVRAHLIRNAKNIIDVQTFIWANDETGRFMAFELLKTARRGVKIRIRDGEAVWIGSSNIDPRSARVNSENAFIISDKDFARLPSCESN